MGASIAGVVTISLSTHRARGELPTVARTRKPSVHEQHDRVSGAGVFARRPALSLHYRGSAHELTSPALVSVGGKRAVLEVSAPVGGSLTGRTRVIETCALRT